MRVRPEDLQFARATIVTAPVEFIEDIPGKYPVMNPGGEFFNETEAPFAYEI